MAVHGCKVARRVARTPPALGFTLLEVLVAVLVVAVGVLGMAKLQAVGLSGGKGARIRTMVALQAESLAALVASLPSFWGTAARDYTLAGGRVTVSATSAAVTPGPDCSAVNCTSQDMALFDLARWSAELNAHFPGATGRVSCNDKTPRECTVEVRWQERVVLSRSAGPAANPGPSSQSFTLHVVP